MAENVQITPGSGVTIGADSVTDISLGSAQIQYIKIMDGSIGGTNKAGVTSNGLAVDGSGVTQPISVSSLPLPTGAATSANQSSEISLLTTIASNTTGASTPVVSGTVTVIQPTAANLNAVVSQTIAANLATESWLNDGSGNAISSTSGALDVSVSNFPSIQTVAGTVTANAGTGTFQTNVTNSSIPVTQSGIWNVTNVTGSVSLPTGAATEATLSDIKTDLDQFTFASTRLLVDGSGVTQPISGTVTVNPLTNTSVVTVELEDGAGNPITSQVNGSQQALDVGINVAGVQIDPRQIRTLTSSDTVSAVQSGSWTVSLTSGSIEIGTVDQGNPNTLANAWPVIPTDGTHSQSFTVAGEAKVSVTEPLPAGTNVIGHVIADSGSTTVVTGNVTVVQTTGSNLHVNIDNFPATQAVTQSGIWSTRTQDGSGNAITSTSNALDINLKTSSITLPISAVSLPLPTGAATSANQTNASQKTQIVDGSGNVIASTSNSLNVNVTNTEPISGTVTSNQGTPNTLANAWPVELSDGTNLLGTSAHPVRIDPTGTTTQPISGTITANQGTSPWVVSLTSTTITGTVAVTQSTSPWVVSGTVTANAGTGNFTVVQATGTNLHTVLDSGTLTSITNALPAGTNVIGHVITDSGSTTAVTGNVTVVQTTGTNLHTVIDSGTVTANIGTTNGLALDATVAKLTLAQSSTTASQTGPLIQGAVTTGSPTYTTTQTSPLSLTTAGALRVDASATTQPISGTVTVGNATLAVTQSGTWTVSLTTESIEIGKVDQGAPNTLANAWPVELSDGTNLLGVSAHPVRTDPTGTTTQPISGTVTANAGTGSFTVVQATGTNLHTVLDSGTLTSITNALPAGTNVIGHVITDSGSTTAVTGNVTVVQGTGTNLHTVVDSGSITVANASIAVTQSTSPWVVSLTSTTITGTVTVAGNLTHNNAAPAANNIGVLPAVASTAAPTYTTGDQVLLSTDLSGNLRVVIDGTVTEQNVNLNQVGGSAIAIGQAAMAASLPVVIASNQSSIPVTLTSTTITGTVAVTQSTSPWVVSGTVTTTPPANASTNITQWDSVALGAPSAYGTSPGAVNVIGVNAFITNTPTVTANAGTGTFTVSGTVTANAGTNLNTSALALDTSVNGILVAQGSTTSGEKGPLIQGAVTTAAPTYSTTQTSPLSLTTAGALRTDSSATTQPISGTVTVNQGTAAVAANKWPIEIVDSAGVNVTTVTGAGALKVDGSAVTQPVSGTVTANAGTGTFTVGQATGTNLHTVVDSGTLTSITNAVTVEQATPANLQATVTQQTITKGTQGSTGVTTQDLKDAGRTFITFTADAIAGVTTEALVSFTLNKAGTATAAQTNYTITNGKTLRIQVFSSSVQSGAAAGEWVRAKLRINTAGATTATSPLVITVEAGSAAAATATAGSAGISIPDGLEIVGNGTITIGMSHLSSATTNAESITLIGYEY